MVATLLVLTLVCPVSGPNHVWDNYGAPRPNGRAHGGIDIDAAIGTPLIAVADGTIVGRVDGGGGGNSLTLTTADGQVFFYAHMNAPTFRSNGERVGKGDVIGFVGDSGNARNPHLHFSVYPHGRPGWTVDPYPLLDCSTSRPRLSRFPRW